jgi:hypothetical protein
MRTVCTLWAMTFQEWATNKNRKDAEIAAMPGVELSRSQVSRIRRYGTTSLPTARRLAAALKLPVEAFSRPHEAA